MAKAYYIIKLPYLKAESLRKDDSMSGGQRRNTLVIEALTRWVAIIMLLALDLICLLENILPEWHFCPKTRF